MDGMREGWVAPDGLAYAVITWDAVRVGSTQVESSMIDFSIRGQRTTWRTGYDPAQHPKQLADFQLRDYFNMARQRPPVRE